LNKRGDAGETGGRHAESRAEKYSAMCVYVYLYIAYTINRRGPHTHEAVSPFVITFSHSDTVWSASPHFGQNQRHALLAQTEHINTHP
jgi:hypothetical protein